MSTTHNQNPKAIQDKLANLIQVNGRDYCIKSRLSKNHIDIQRFFNKKDLINFYSDPKKPVIDFNENLNQIDLDYYLSITNSPNEFITILNNEGIGLSDTKVKQLQNSFESTKKAIIKDIKSKYGDQKRQLLKINQHAKNILDDTGLWSLFLAHYFLMGSIKTKDQAGKTIINAPLLFYPVEIVQINRKLVLKKREDKFILNEKLFNFIKKSFSPDWELAEILAIKDVNQIIEIIKTTLELPITINEEITNFVEVNPNMFEQQNGLIINNSSILGIYEPSGGRLKADLEILVANNIDPFAKDNKISDKQFVEDEVKGAELIEIGRPLNIYQRYAIRSSLMQDTVIYGPPGTGKSEVIANIIANAIASRKSVLVVSEKKAALDVLHERLSSISNLAIFLYDLDNREMFYKKIADVNKKLGLFWTEQQNIDHFDIKNRIINSKEYDEFENLKKELRKEIVKVLNLYNFKDSKNHNFNDYAKAMLMIPTKTLNQIRDYDLIPFIEQIMKKFFINNVDKLFSEIKKYKEFIEKYGLNGEQVSEKLKIQKIQLTEYQIKNNIIGYLTKNKQILETKVNQLQRFFSQFKLDKNEEFLKILNKNKHLLIDQLEQFKEFYQEHGNLLKKGFYGFLTTNYEKLNEFIKIYESAKDNHKDYIINKFLQEGILETKKPLFAKKYEIDLNKNEKLTAIKTYLKIDYANFGYLLELLKIEDVISEDVVFVFLNQWLLNSYIEDLNTSNFVFFNNDIMKKIKSIEINNEQFELIKDVLNYEKDVLNGKRELIETNLNTLLFKLRQMNNRIAKNSAKQIELFYFEYLKFVLQQKQGEELEKVKEIFKISGYEKKYLPSIQKFVNKYHDELRLIFPIWISKPELVAEMIPLKQDFFNYGIFDEASQMYVEKAYPLIYRTQVSIVAGDDKQLKPSSFFVNRFDLSNEEYALADTDQVDSLLDRSKVSLWSSFNLKNHYRSAHKDLIKFSNEYIYNNNLNFATYNGVYDAGIEVINVDGVWELINKEEANKVLELINKNLDKYQKILVVTFGVRQSDYIEELVLKDIDNNEKLFQKMKNNNLVITNLENVQGNEADLVILSVSYSRKADGGINNMFGPLITYGGLNRLNVAITRAKKKMIIVKSINASEMNPNIDNPNAVILKSFISFCDNFVKETRVHKQIKAELNQSDVLHKNVGKYLKILLLNENMTVLLKENYDIGSEVLNYVLVDKKTNKVILAIIISDTFKNLSFQKVLENIDKFNFIQDRGFNAILIQEHEWIANQNNLLSKIRNILLMHKDKHDH